jgi:hypothetical protein
MSVNALNRQQLGLKRGLAYEAGGREFESLRARHVPVECQLRGAKLPLGLASSLSGMIAIDPKVDSR